MRKNAGKRIKLHLGSAQIIPLGFLLLIVLGTLLLLLPFATAPGRETSVLTALFTATTSVCVTGLVVVDTYAHWTLFGKIVILLLIQAGGLGVIAVSSSVLLLLGKSFSIRDRVLLRDSFNLGSISGLIRFLLRVFRGVFLVEGVGSLLYAAAFIPRYGWVRGLWYGVFHAVSAFCNAGIDVLGPDSLIPFADDPLVLSVTMALIVLGGLGFIVWFDLTHAFRKGRRVRRLGEHTRLVLWTTLALIVSGAALLLPLEWNNPETLGRMPVWQKLLNALFQSVTFRTAGFATVPQTGLTDASALLGCLYMFIGGSPMGTAGGVKTVTFFVLLASTYSYIRNRAETLVFRRRISDPLVRKAAAIVCVSLAVSVLASAALIASDGLTLTDGMYEVFSATATVGLSRGVTPGLSAIGRCIIIICMYLGRIGPISMALFFGQDDAVKNEIQHANGRYYVG